MNAKFRRIIVWILLLSLILSLVPAVVLTAFAENAHEGAHDLTGWAVVTGDETKCERHCQIEGCDYSETEAHDYTGVTPVDAGSGKHTLECTRCSAAKEEEHTFDREVIDAAYRQDDDTYFCSCACGAQGDDTFPVHTVTFDPAFEGAEAKPVVVKAADAVNEPADVTTTRTGYRFDGWYNSETGETEFVPGSAVDSSFTVTAKWVKTYTVTFDKGTASSIHETFPSQIVDAGTQATAPEQQPTTADALVFTGWDWDFSNEVNEDITVTAVWADAYTVTVDPAIDHGQVTASAEKAAPGQRVGLTVTPVAGYTLKALTYTPADGTAQPVTGDSFLMPNQNVTVTAVFTEAPVELTVGSHTLSGRTGKALAAGDKLTVTVNHAEFADVSADTLKSCITVNKPAGVDFTAQRKSASQIELAFTGTPTAAMNEPVEIRLAKDALKNAPAAPADYTAAENADAKWAVAQSCTVAVVNDNAKGTVTLTPDPVLPGETLTVTVSPKGGFKVDSVSYKKNREAEAHKLQGNGVYTLNVPADAEELEITVTYKAVVTVTLNNGGETNAAAGTKGTVQMLPSREDIYPGDVVAIAVTANAPYRVDTVTMQVGTAKAESTSTVNGKYYFDVPETAAAVTFTVTYKRASVALAPDAIKKVKSFGIKEYEDLADEIISGSTVNGVETTSSLSLAQEAALAHGGDYTFILDVQSGKDNTADIEKLKKATNIAAVKQAVYTGDSKYLDITLWMYIYDADGDEVGEPIQITDTGSHYVSLSFDALRSPATRLYYVHDGKTGYYAQESGSTSGNVKYSKLHKFSTYELVYTTVSDNPKTADPFHAPLWLAVFVLTGLSLPAVIFGGKKYLR